MSLLESPRARIKDAEFEEIDQTLRAVGHVVVEDVWNPRFLTMLRHLVQVHFDADDARFAGNFDKFPQSVIDTYLGGFTNLDELSVTPQALDRGFFTEVERSGLPALYRFLFEGNFVVARSERVIRRVDPRFPLRFAGLHQDGQLRLCSSRGLQSQREITLWTPLQDCISDEIARLLLLHRGETYKDLFAEDERMEVQHVKYLPVTLRPHAIRDEEPQVSLLLPKIDTMYERIFRSRKCYAPPVPLGSAVMFEHDVFHGSYFTSRMTQARFSLDFRTVGEYHVNRTNRLYSGVLLAAAQFPPPPLWRRLARRVRRRLRKLVRR